MMIQWQAMVSLDEAINRTSQHLRSLKMDAFQLSSVLSVIYIQPKEEILDKIVETRAKFEKG